MAIFHFSGQVISRSQGRNAVAAAAYRSAEKLFDERNGKTQDFTKKEQDILYKEVMLPSGAPEWMKDRNKLWNEVEKNEKRKDAQLAREFNIALPKELSPKQNIELAKEFVQKEFVDKGMVADLCLHKGHNGTEEQPHIHVMLTMREVTPDGFGKKVREWNGREQLEHQREAWAECANKHLALNGHDIRIDHRSNAERGIDLEPQYKIGAKAAERAMARFEDHQRIARENGEKIYADPSIALETITKQQSTFTHQDLARFINTHTVDPEQFQRVYDRVKVSEQMVFLGKDEQGRERFTTQEMLVLEKQMLSYAQSLQKDRANSHAITQTLNVPEHFSEEQRTALEHMISRGDIKCVIGYAGSGKSTILSVAKEAWEHEGFKVHGVTLSGIAAENLTGASGIESRTFASRSYYWDRGEQKLTHKDILVVDEAGMLGSRQMARLLEEVYAGNAKIILIGDPQQLQAIEAGAAFRAIAELTNYLELTQVRRQHEKWQQEATKEFAVGKVEEALERYAKHDHLHEFDTKLQAKQRLVEMWNDVRISNPQKTQIILAYTRKDAKELNEMAREVRISNNELGEDRVIKTERGERQFAEGDRIYFLKNERSLGVMNGTLGTIEKIDHNNITVRLDKDLENSNSRAIQVDLNLYNHLEHGYAATIHKAQGVTVDRSYVLASKYMDSHSSYVALSRHRESTDLFWGKDEFTNQRALSQSLGRDRSKDVTLDYGVLEEKFSNVIHTKAHRQEKPDLRKKTKEQDLEPRQKLERPLTSIEIKEIYKLRDESHDKLQEIKKAYEAEKQFDPLQAFKARYESEYPEKAKAIQQELQPAFERKALKIEQEVNLLERAIERSNMPRTHKQQLEQCAVKAMRDKDVMNYFSTHNQKLAEKIMDLAQQREARELTKSKELSLERDMGWER
jgi:Ti-type conjugative transfer relaxase TraA